MDRNCLDCNGMMWSGRVWNNQVLSAFAWSGLKRGVIWPGLVELFAGNQRLSLECLGMVWCV